MESPQGSISPRRKSNTSSRPEGHQCHVCHRSFGRAEHLTRHARSHSNARPMECKTCGKGFYRADALRRHELVHRASHNGLTKGARACTACAEARRKCTGGATCSGCQKRSLKCDFESVNEGVRHPDSRTSSVDNDHLNDANTEAADRPMSSSWQQNSVTSNMFSNSIQDQESSINTNQTINMNANYMREKDLASGSRHDGHSYGTPFQSSFDRAGNILRNDSVTPGGETRTLETADLELWQQDNLLAMNWSFDNIVPTYESENYHTEFTMPPFASRLQLPTESPDIPIDASPNSNNSNRSNLGLGGHGGSSPHTGRDGSSSISVDSGVAAGHFYVDGDGARLPRIKNLLQDFPASMTESLLSLSQTTESPGNDGTFGFSESIVQSIQNREAALDSDLAWQVPPRSYQKMADNFSQTCGISSYFKPFRSSFFPPCSALDIFLQHYFADFQQALPFIHVPSFEPHKVHWLLILAMSAIGSHFTRTGNHDLSLAMHEFLRRAICVAAEDRAFCKENQILMAQVKLLNSIGLMYSGDTSGLGGCWQPDLRNFYEDEWPSLIDFQNRRSMQCHSPGEEHWRGWYNAEGLRRLGYCVSLLDCMSAFSFLTRTQISADDKGVQLPCQEVLWEAESADFDPLYSCAIPSPSMQVAIQQIYIEKRLQPSMGEFSRILLIHALFRRTWEVESYFQQPLTQWIPTAERQRTSVLPDKDSIWLPSIPAYSKWRNSACDCLDVLHWHANSVIGAASGMEHPTVLHLHLARVILLTPFRDIVKLANLMAEENAQRDRTELSILRKRVQRWALQDQYKARLAMIHAGVLFWHVRRYSTNAFYEASSVFLGTVALWAYGTFAQHIKVQHNEDDEPSAYPTTMQLDRPADDELVQLFVSRGTNMSACITGVGDVTSAKGPERVLLEGGKLLVNLSVWGISSKHASLLARLAKKCRVV